MAKASYRISAWLASAALAATGGCLRMAQRDAVIQRTGSRGEGKLASGYRAGVSVNHRAAKSDNSECSAIIVRTNEFLKLLDARNPKGALQKMTVRQRSKKNENRASGLVSAKGILVSSQAIDCIHAQRDVAYVLFQQDISRDSDPTKVGSMRSVARIRREDSVWRVDDVDVPEWKSYFPGVRTWNKGRLRPLKDKSLPKREETR